MRGFTPRTSHVTCSIILYDSVGGHHLDIESKVTRRRKRPRRRNNAKGPTALAPAVQKSTPLINGSTSSLLPLKRIDFGETDANAEYFIAKRENLEPMFVRAFYDADSAYSDNLATGRKFILYGQKGTGKTAILRHLDSVSRSTYSTEFVVFRKEIIEEAQLASLAATFSANVVVDEDKIKSTHFYYHAMKRLLLTILLSKSEDIADEIPDDASWFRKVYAEIKGSSVGQIASLVTDSVIGSIQAINVDVSKATKGVVSVSPDISIKRSNDAFQKFAFAQFKKRNVRARIFLDEMHFAYHDKQTLGADAALVRDTVLAVREINEKLIDQQIDSMIYISVRSEFLEHQEIAVSDIAHTIESYGAELSWESARFNREHPMFFVMLERLKLNFTEEITRDTMLSRYIPKQRISDFLEYTWGKPRDIIRYFKAAQLAYPNNATIRPHEFSNVIRRYSQLAWQDIKAALTAFVPKNSLPILEDALQRISNHNFDSSEFFDREKLKYYLKPAYDSMKKDGVSYDINELIKLLYIVGIFYVRYRDANSQMIIHQFHRGNRHPAEKSEYLVHRAVARAFS